ncbi:MAG: hypothetical protein D6776_07950 [Planctomycetota bacterium]|nr:MAG: hypothetical protein D6776_07950 [Planctomycetota bacterium]
MGQRDAGGAGGLLLAALVALLAAGCGGSGGGGGGSLSVASVDPDTSSVLVSGYTGFPADGASAVTVTVTVRDRRGRPLAGYRVALEVSGRFNTIEQPAAPTGADGIAIGRVRTTRAETKRITVFVIDPSGAARALAQRPGVAFVAVDRVGAPLGSLSVALPPGGAIADGRSAVTVTVVVRDPFANPLGGRTVQLFAQGVTGARYTIVPPTGTAQPDGRFVASVTTTAAGRVTFSARVISGPDAPVDLDARASVDFLPDPARLAAASATVTATPTADIVADGVRASVITIELADAAGEPIIGAELDLDVSGSGNVIDPPPPTDATGRTQGRVASTVAETKTVTAILDPAGLAIALPDRPVLTFVGDPAAVSASASTIVVSPTAGVIANGIEAATVTVTVRDRHGNLVPGANVALTVTATGASLDPPAGTTGAAGRFSSLLRSTEPGPVTVSASVGGQPLTATAVVVFDPAPASPTASSVVASPTTGLVADGQAAATITVTLRDDTGRALAGRPVTLSASVADATIDPPGGDTDANGVFTATLRSLAAGDVTVTARADPGTASEVQLADRPVLTFDEPLPEIVSIALPAAPLEGCVPVRVAVRYVRERRVDLALEFRRSPADPFEPASLGDARLDPASEGPVGVSTSADPAGAEHVLLWNAAHDLPGETLSSLELRVTARRGALVGPARTERGISIDHGLRFAAPLTLAAGALNTNGVVLADLDADGLLDVALANQVAAVTVLRQDASAPGSFLPPVVLGAGLSPIALAAADLDRDGRIDLVIANRNDTRITVLFGDASAAAGTLAFLPPVQLAVGASPVAVAVADLNADGWPDVASAGLDADSVTVRLQDPLSPGSFPDAMRADLAVDATPGTDDPQALAAGDLDGDGLADLAVGLSSPGGIAVWINETAPGASTVTATLQRLDDPSLEDCTAVAIGDLDRDGRPDLVGAFAGSDRIGRFAQSSLGSASFFLAGTDPLPAGAAPRALALADLDADGRLDVVSADFGAGEALVLRGDPSSPGALLPAQAFAAAADPWAVAVGDLDRDGRADLVLTSQRDDLAAVLFGTRALGCGLRYRAAAATRSGDGVDPGTRSLAAADLDADGRLDLALANPNNGTVSVLRGRGDGRFEPREEIAVGTEPIAVALADLDGDERADLVVLDAAAPLLSIYPNETPTGSATLSFGAPHDLAVAAGPAGLAVGDFDGDGQPDLAVGSQGAQSVRVWRNAAVPGALAFDAALDVAIGRAPSQLLALDVDDDGRDDLAFTDPGGGQLGLLHSAATAPPLSFDAPELHAVGAGASSLAAGDLNDDARPELVLGYEAGSGAQAVTVLVNTTLGLPAPPSFAPAFDRDCGGEPRAVAVGDVDGDGRADVIAVCAGPDRLVVLRNATLAGATQPDFDAPEGTALPVAADAALARDLDTDGTLDVALATASAAAAHALVVRGDAQPGVLRWRLAERFGAGSGAVALAAADLDRDGRLDLATADGTGGSVSVLRGAADPALLAPVTFTALAQPAALAALDLHGRGAADLVVLDPAAGELAVLRNDTPRGGALDFAPPFVVSIGAGASRLAAGDLDRDGDLDLVLLDPAAGGAGGLRNDTPRGGTATALVAFALPALSASPDDLAIGDLDRDGRDDLVFVRTDALWLARNTTPVGAASPSFDTPVLVTATAGSRLALADLDGDGAQDVLVLDPAAGRLRLWRNATAPGGGAWQLEGSGSVSVPTGLDAIAVAELTGDAALDVALTDTAHDTILLLPNASVRGAPVQLDPPEGWASAGPGPVQLLAVDLDGDGARDLLTVQPGDATVGLSRAER